MFAVSNLNELKSFFFLFSYTSRTLHFSNPNPALTPWNTLPLPLPFSWSPYFSQSVRPPPLSPLLIWFCNLSGAFNLEKKMLHRQADGNHLFWVQ